MKKGGKGRPTKLTKEVQAKIVSAIRAGNYMETAAAFAGIHKSTFHDWMKQGQRLREKFEKSGEKPDKNQTNLIHFSDSIEKALAEAEMRDVMTITQASEEDWKAAAWRLERKHPQRWGRKVIYQGDEREKLALEKMKADLERIKTETSRQQYELARMRGDVKDEYEDDGFIEALDSATVEVWEDEETD